MGRQPHTENEVRGKLGLVAKEPRAHLCAAGRFSLSVNSAKHGTESEVRGKHCGVGAPALQILLLNFVFTNITKWDIIIVYYS